MMQFTVFSASTLKLNKHLTRSITNQIYREKNYGKKLYLSQFNKQASKLKRVRENFNFFWTSGFLNWNFLILKI